MRVRGGKNITQILPDDPVTDLLRSLLTALYPEGRVLRTERAALVEEAREALRDLKEKDRRLVITIADGVGDFRRLRLYRRNGGCGGLIRQYSGCHKGPVRAL